MFVLHKLLNVLKIFAIDYLIAVYGVTCLILSFFIFDKLSGPIGTALLQKLFFLKGKMVLYAFTFEILFLMAGARSKRLDRDYRKKVVLICYIAMAPMVALLLAKFYF